MPPLKPFIAPPVSSSTCGAVTELAVKGSTVGPLFAPAIHGAAGVGNVSAIAIPLVFQPPIFVASIAALPELRTIWGGNFFLFPFEDRRRYGRRQDAALRAETF